jgi:hypothetical protein
MMSQSIIGRSTNAPISNFGDRAASFQPRFFMRMQKLPPAKVPRNASLFIDTTTFDAEEVQFKGKSDFQTYDHTKKANDKCRWNLLWLPLCILGPFPLWLSFVDCRISNDISFIFSMLLSVNYIYATVLCWRYTWRMIRAFNTPYLLEIDEEDRNGIYHVVVMPTYREPLDLLLATMSSVANQTVADRIIMAVGMEEKTPDR